MKIINYISDAFTELKDNVTWPEWAEVQRLTIIVAVFSVVCALAVSGTDELFSKAISGFFTMIKG